MRALTLVADRKLELIDVPAGQQLETVELHDSLFSAGTSVSVK